jgi:hypothetical protein
MRSTVRKGALNVLGIANCKSQRDVALDTIVLRRPAVSQTERSVNEKLEPAPTVLVTDTTPPIAHSGPDKAAAMIRTDLDKWSPFIQALGLSSHAPTRSASPRR